MTLGIALALTNGVYSAPIAARSSGSEDPIVRRDLINKVTKSVYIIPDNFVRLVPNIGIIAEAKTILITDTDLGIKKGSRTYETIKELSKNKAIYTTIADYHSEHSLGEAGLG